jgi:hypothetical protein
MSGWSIQIPYRDRSDPLSTVADAARSLPADQDRAVARQLVLDGARDGLVTAGDLLDRLDAMSPEERRALLDQTRSEVGLPTASAIDASRRYDEQSRVLSIASASAPPLRLAVGPAGLIDLGAAEIEAERHAVARMWTGANAKTPGAQP